MNNALDGVKWVGNVSQCSNDFVDYNENSDKGCFLQVDIRYLEKLHELHNDLPFLSKWMKIENVEKLVVNWHDKKNNFYRWEM